MKKTNSEPKVAAGRALRRSVPAKRNQTNVDLGAPGFLVRLAGWRRLKSALTESLPQYRHD